MAGSLNMNVYSLNVEDDNNDNDLVGTSESDRLDGKNSDDIIIDDLAKLGVGTVQSNVQNIKCEIKGFFGSIDDSCFNSNDQNLGNEGNIALAQDGGNGRGRADGSGDGERQLG